MTFKQKRKINKKQGRKLLFIHLTDTDISFYGPDHFESVHDALDEFEKMIMVTARQNGFYKKEVFTGAYEMAAQKIYELWEDYNGELGA